MQLSILLALWVSCAVRQSLASPSAGSSIQPVPLKDIRKLLTDEYMNLEAGYGQSSDGLDVVAASTYMRGVTGSMIDWWFSWLSHTDKYKMWHPRDHVFADWVPPPSGEGYIGGHHLVKEYIGGELQNLNISFKDPATYFGPNWRAEFDATNHSTAVVGRVSFYDFDKKESNEVGHLLHLIHNEPDGVRMRSRFWLGDLGVPIDIPPGESLVPQVLTRGLQKHASEEMAILGTILPELWRQNSKEGKAGKATGFDKSDPNGHTYPGPHGV
jgi:DAPG hydrolase PhiG domain